jgi:glutamate/tyrosine decarboxylase-like PLP-dependent enzyme
MRANPGSPVTAEAGSHERSGWDVENDGVFGAPQLTVVVGDEVHASLLKVLGRKRVIRVPADEQGRMRADRLPALDDRCIVCIQAGYVNSGAFDPAAAICRRAREAGAWVHVVGAFGLWAAASPQHRHLTEGFDLADSWATDGHKWPNVGYDCGIAMVRNAAAMRAAMAISAAYVIPGELREPSNYTPEMSRRARRGVVGHAEIVGTPGPGGINRTDLPACPAIRRGAARGRP